MNKSLYIIIGVASLLLSSCGQQQRAKSAVKDFMKEQLHKDDVSYLDFSDVDSTSVISDSLVAVMRGRGPKGIHYQERSSKSLLHIRAKYLFGADTCSTTFYLNPETSGIVAYKDN